VNDDQVHIAASTTQTFLNNPAYSQDVDGVFAFYTVALTNQLKRDCFYLPAAVYSIFCMNCKKVTSVRQLLLDRAISYDFSLVFTRNRFPRLKTLFT